MHGLQTVMSEREPGRRSRTRACACGTGGFTLIELMIVVVVIAVLAAVAYPAYTSHLAKGRRAAAQSHLMNLATKEAQYLLDKRAYATSETELGVTMPPEVAAYYNSPITFDVSNTAVPPTFKLTAIPKPGTAQANDGNLTIDQAGAKTPTDKW